uniref:Uncharacterized protein n=1 Tax=Arundo donax TaxID=35708 RepID=A0A0A9FP26_ARUDO
MRALTSPVIDIKYLTLKHILILLLLLSGFSGTIASITV